jgi:hypothetical protein
VAKHIMPKQHNLEKHIRSNEKNTKSLAKAWKKTMFVMKRILTIP